MKVESESAIVRANIKVWSTMKMIEMESMVKGGDKVPLSSGFVLKGLKSQPELNGKEVNIVLDTVDMHRQHTLESRMTVELETAPGVIKVFKVKWANLERREQSGKVSSQAGVEALNKITLASAAAVLAHKRAQQSAKAEPEGGRRCRSNCGAR